MQLISIGQVYSEAEHKNLSVKINKDYRNALKYLNQFSHIHLFYIEEVLENVSLKDCIAEIQNVDIKTGELHLLTEQKIDKECQLIDIKPYFPCEDTVLACDAKENTNTSEVSVTETSVSMVHTTEEPYQYEISKIGEIRNTGNEYYIQLEEAFQPISSHIKIFWWFDKFDKKQFRKATLCNPPYENAPQTGIFATRSPVRPNPLAMTIARVIRIDYKQHRVYISGIESFDHTPCVGIERYIQERDCVMVTSVPKWLEHWPKSLDDRVSTEMRSEGIHLEHSELEDILYDTEDSFHDKEDFTNKEEIINQNTFNSIETFSNNKNQNTIHKRGKRVKGIYVHGAREHNLRGIDLKIPYGKITAVVGVSGSGKSSLVKDTIYAECNRRMQYISSNIRLNKPDMDDCEGCIPCVYIAQDAIRGNIFSTVGTYTDTYDYLRCLYAKIATRHCPECGKAILISTKKQICYFLSKMNHISIYDLQQNLIYETIHKSKLQNEVSIALEKGKGAFYIKLASGKKILIQTKQYCYHCNKVLFDMTPATFSYLDGDARCPVCHGTGQVLEVDEEKLIAYPNLSLLDGASLLYGKLRNFIANPNANWMKGQVFGLANEMHVDLEKTWNEYPKEFRIALLHGTEKEVTFFYQNKRNGRNGEIKRPVEGMYAIVENYQAERYLKRGICKTCQGERLGTEGRIAAINGVRYPEAAKMSFHELKRFLTILEVQSTKSERDISKCEREALLEIAETAEKLGIGYLPLNRDTTTLSGGEGQRLKLLGAFKNHISGILYLFDEPSKGLHPGDYEKVADMLRTLKEEGNTILMVEHNEDMIRIADHVIEIGPGAGALGGQLIGAGTLYEMLHNPKTQVSMFDSLRCDAERNRRIDKNTPMVTYHNMNCHNLKNISVSFPQNAMTCICGVSGSGKTSLMKGEIYERAKKDSHFSEVILVDQQPIGKTSKSIIATYVDVMDQIKNLFAETKEAKKKNWDAKYFGFNTSPHVCENCKGDGRVKMKYMDEVYTKCPDCDGKRYQQDILSILYDGKNVNEVLSLSVSEAIAFLSNREVNFEALKSLEKVGLGYLTLGQGTKTLSGGEAARLKLSRELCVKKKNNVLYLLDEPTTGLHFSDINHLLDLMDELIDRGNTVMAIEHNKQFLNHSDYKIELGPGAYTEGGTVLFCGFNEN